MERVLRRTYGVIVYQEQVIEVASAVAGFSLAEADVLRRTMTHERSMEEMDAIGRDFVEKAMARGTSREVADEVFRQLRGFAAYGFNKAHAACFAIVCNASAWLKAHYPAEFYCGILNNQPMGFYSPRVVLNDARRFGLEVLPLDVNLSGEWFEVERDGTALRVGLACVKEMSAAARRAIVEAREDHPYTSLADFIARTRVSREITENLSRLGAFDALGVRREELVAQVPLLYAGARSAPASLTASTGGGSGLDQPRLALDEQFGPLSFLPDWSAQRRVSIELELLGLNVGAHPLRFVRDQIEALRVTPMGRLPEVRHGSRVRVAGVLERAQMPWIRSGHRTMFLTLEDETELGQVVVFNDVYLKHGRVLKDAVYLLVDGELQNDEEHGLAVVAHRVSDLLRVIGRDDQGGRGPGGRHASRVIDSPATAGPAAGGHSVPGGLSTRRPDAWELPAVEPRTRPGRTG
jgi:error-prone DNA polymerase